MSNFTARFIGSGDAFGSGGRLQTCILIDSPDIRFAIDFGTTSLAGLRKQGIEPNTIDAIVVSHLHGDHCGGIPFFLLDAMLGAKRSKPLTIIGPRNTQPHVQQLQAVLFPGSDVMAPKFDLLIAECYFYSKSVKWHMNYPDIAKLSAKNVVLTHMHDDMLAHVNDVPENCAFDGYVIDF